MKVTKQPIATFELCALFDSSDETFHGDDLAFVFDARPLEGQKDPTRGQVSLTDPEDMKVRDIFTNLIANFAHKG